MTSRGNLRETENRHVCYFALLVTAFKFAFVAPVAKDTSVRYRKQTTEELLNYFTKTLSCYCKSLLAFHVVWSSGGASVIWHLIRNSNSIYMFYYTQCTVNHLQSFSGCFRNSNECSTSYCMPPPTCTFFFSLSLFHFFLSFVLVFEV